MIFFYNLSLLYQVVLSAGTVTSAQGQGNEIFTSGYIVMDAGDTVYGRLKLLNTEESCEYLVFKRDSSDATEKYNAKKVKGYKRGLEMFCSREVIRPSWFGDKNNFVKLIVTGKVNVYQYNYKQDTHGQPVYHVNHITEYYLEKEGKFKRIANANYKNDLWAFFKGDKEMVNKVRKTKYDYDFIPQMVTAYNKEN